MSLPAHRAVNRSLALPLPEIDARSSYLYLVRHGATEANLQRPPWLQGRGADLPLCESGLHQAESAAQLLHELPVARVVTSPLRRARQTAETIAARHGLHVECLSELMECDVGRWEGIDWDTIARTDPEAHRQFLADPAFYGYPEGETFADVHARAAPVFQQLLAESLGKIIVAVSHNVVNRTYLASLLGMPLSKARFVRQDNGCINIVRWDEGRAELITLNAAFSWTPDPVVR